MSERRMTCPHCLGSRHMHMDDPAFGACIFCGEDGRMAEREALLYAAGNRTIAREGVLCGDITPSRAAELLREAGEIEAFFAPEAPCPEP